MKLKIIGQNPDVNFNSIGYEIVDTNDYDIILSCYGDNTTSIESYNESLAMIFYTKDVPKEESQNYICSRSRNAKAVMVEGDYQFYRQLYRYREAVFFCHRDKKKPEDEYKRIFDWIMWEREVSHIPINKYIDQLKREGISSTHCVEFDEDYYAAQFGGDKDWETKRQNLDGVIFTGFDPKIVYVPTNKIVAYMFRDRDGLERFMLDPLQHPKAENDAPSWRRLLYGIAKNGIANPVLVYKHRNGNIILTKGKHRFIAAIRLGLKTMPVIMAHEV